MATNGKSVKDNGSVTKPLVGTNGTDEQSPIGEVTATGTETTGTTGTETTGTNEQSIEFTISDGTSSVQNGKRGRGRPRKNPQENPQTFTKPKAQKVSAQDKKDAKELTEFIISSFEMMSMMILNSQDTQFNDMEKFLLEPALRRQLERMDFSAIDKANRFLDPLFILGALALWTNRVIIHNKKDKTGDNSTNKNEISTSDVNQAKSDAPNIAELLNFKQT